MMLLLSPALFRRESMSKYYVSGRRDPETDAFVLHTPGSEGYPVYVACEAQKLSLLRLNSNYQLYQLPDMAQPGEVMLVDHDKCSEEFPDVCTLTDEQWAKIQEAIKYGGRWLEPGDPRLQPVQYEIKPKKKKEKTFDR